MTDAPKTPIRALIEAVEADAVNWYGWAEREGALPDGLWEVARAAEHGSLDAANALYEALLPGWNWGRLVSHGTMIVSREYGQYKSFSELDVKNPARAWLLAILRAYLHEQESK